VAGDGDQIGHEARLLDGGCLILVRLHYLEVLFCMQVRARGPFGEGDGHCGRQIRPEVPVEA